MDAQAQLHRLRSLRDRIAALSIVKCRMVHEQVVRAGDSGLPVSGRAGEGRYRRVGLCTPEQRAMRLGCSHTTARTSLDVAIRELATHRADAGVTDRMDAELTFLDNAIHLLDHRKGEAEKALATALGEAGQPGEHGDRSENVRKAKDELHDLERQHDEYVDRIGRLRDSVVRELDALTARGPGD
jgi:hypothetical protein